MDATTLLPLSLAALLYALVSRRAFGRFVSVPMAFTALGLALGSAGLGWTELAVSSAALNDLAEITLVLTLFGDASSIDVTRLRRRHALPMRLLGIGLPLTVLAGLGCALLVVPGLTLVEAALVAIVLAPTDASLGQAVVTNPAVPERMRRALNVESGLNDGLVFPILLVVVSIAIVETEPENARSALDWVGFTLAQVALGPAAGIVVGWSGARLADAALARDRISTGFLRLSTIALPLVAYGGAELVSGNGFLAAFACGLTVGAVSKPLRARIEDFAEAEGELLTLFVFFALGAVLLPATLAQMEWRHALYALLSLTVVRMVPVALCLAGAGLDRAEHRLPGLVRAARPCLGHLPAAADGRLPARRDRGDRRDGAAHGAAEHRAARRDGASAGGTVFGAEGAGRRAAGWMRRPPGRLSCVDNIVL